MRLEELRHQGPEQIKNKSDAERNLEVEGRQQRESERVLSVEKVLCINKSLIQHFSAPSKVLRIYQGKNISLYILGSNASLYFRLNFPIFLEFSSHNARLAIPKRSFRRGRVTV